jgi:hypothetical protein
LQTDRPEFLGHPVAGWITMNRAFGAVAFALLLVLWPMAGIAGTAQTLDGASSGDVGDDPSAASAGPDDGSHGVTDDRAGNETEEVDTDESGSGEASTGPGYPSERPLFEATTTADSEPAVGEPTTVTLKMTARTDVTGLGVSLPDYPFVAGDGESFAVGDLSKGETRTVNVTVRPTEPIAKYLRFTARGSTDGGVRTQYVSHDLAVVERGNYTLGLPVDSAADTPEGTAEQSAVTSGDVARAGAEAAATGSDTAPGSVSGCFSYTDQNGNFRDGRQLVVEVKDWDWGNPDDTIATGRTNDNGCFDIRVQDPQGADFGPNNVADVYVLVYAANPAAEATNGVGRTTYKVRNPGGHRTMDSGDQVSLGRFTPSSDDPAYQAVDWALDAYRFVESKTGYTRSQVRIQYPQTNWPSYSGTKPFEAITLPDRSTAGWGRMTVHHEYGHALMDSMYGPGKNWPDRCPNQVINNCIDGHGLWSETNPGYAFVEGWAEFLEAAMLYDRSGNYAFSNGVGRGMNIENNEWFNISVNTQTIDGDTIPGADTGDMDGNSHEASVASILFDLYDPRGEDNVDARFKQIFNNVRNNNPENVRDSLNDWSYGQDEGLATTAFRYGIFINDPYQPNNRFSTAAPIGLETVNGTVGRGVDYYEITVPAQTEATVRLDDKYSLSGVDVDLTGYDSGQSLVAASRTASNSESITLPTTGLTPETFYVKVTNSGGPASYELSVNGTFESQYDLYDPIDPEWYLDTRVQWVVGSLSSTSLESVSMEGGQNISYAVNLGPDERFNASNVGEGSVALTLYNQELQQVAESTENQPLSYVAGEQPFTDTNSTTFYLEATALHDEAQPVRLSASTSEPGNDRYEPNDGFASARPIWPTDIEGLELDADDEDYYSIGLREGQELTVDAEVEGLDGALELSVLGPDREVLASETADDVASLRFGAQRTANYTIRVDGVEDAAGVYGLSLDVETPDNDRFDGGMGNDVIDAATEIEPGTYERLRIATGDRDVFAVELADNEQLSASVLFEQSEGDLDLRLYAPSGETLAASASDTDDESLGFEADGAGTYYVAVRGAQGGSADYTLDVETESPEEPDRLEPDGREDPTEVDPGVTEFDGLSLVDGDQDYFAVTIPGVTNVEAWFSATFDHDDGNLEMVLVGPNNQSVASSVSNTDNESISYTVNESGRYAVVLYTENNASVDYSLEIATEEREPDDEPSEGLEPSVDVPSVVAPGAEVNAVVGANRTGTIRIRNAPEGWTVTSTDPSALTTSPGPGELPYQTRANDTLGHVFSTVGENTFTVTMTAPNETGTYNFTAVSTRNGTSATQAFGIEVSESTEHESGVSRRKFDAAAGEDGFDRDDVLNLVGSYIGDTPVGGIQFSREDVLELVTYYIQQ